MLMPVPVMTTEFRLHDVYGNEYPDLNAKVTLFRDVSYRAGNVSLPEEEYSPEDEERFLLGTWEMVDVRVDLFRDLQVVSRQTLEGFEFGEMERGFVNPIGNPDDFPLKLLVLRAVDYVLDSEGVPL